MTAEVSVVIPARNEAGAIGDCLAALTHQTIGAGALEVIVVAAGDDDTVGAATRAGVAAGFARFEVVFIERGNKNVALQVGCGRAGAPVVVLLDADTELAPDAVALLVAAVADGPERAVHGAPLPRYDTWISRYWELNRKLVKDLHFDGALSGEFVALRRATIEAHHAAVLFPDRRGAKGDLYLARVLAERGCRIGYVPAARGTTCVPWTFAGLVATMLRSRRGMMAFLPMGETALQAAFSAVVIGALPVGVVAWSWSRILAAASVAPLAAYVVLTMRRVAALRRRGLGDHRRELPAFVALDLMGRAIKIWAFVERVAGRGAPATFRGDRPDEVGTPRSAGVAGAR